MEAQQAQSQLWRGIVQVDATRVAKALLYGANPNDIHTGPAFFSSIRQGDTPLHALFRTPEKKLDPVSGRNLPPPKGEVARILQALLDAGADPVAISGTGDTPLALFCQRWLNELPVSLLRRFLLASKPVIDTPEPSQGNTPLHLATQRQDLVKVRALLALGARTDVFNHHGKAPVWEALDFIRIEDVYTTPKNEKSWQVLVLLTQHGATLAEAGNRGTLAWVEMPSLPLARLAGLGALVEQKDAQGVDALTAQIEQLEENPGFRLYAKDNLRFLLNTPGVDWTARSRASGRNAAQVVGLCNDADMQAMVGEIKARVEQAQLDHLTPERDAATGKPRL